MNEKRRYVDGIHCIPNDEYHSSSGISRSGLLEFKRSPHHFWHKYMGEPRDISSNTPALVLGNLVHTMVLEPEKFDDEYIVRPPMDRRTNAGKLAYNQFIGMSGGRAEVTLEQFDIAAEMRDAVSSNDLACDLLRDCKVEQSIYFTHAPTGIQVKCRPDAWNGSIVVDLKTSASAHYRDFRGSVFKYGYAIQAAIIKLALHSIGIALEKFVFIVIEKDPPYPIGIYMLDDEVIDYGLAQFEKLILAYSLCLEKNEWPGYPVQTLYLPKWISAEFEHE
jgi:hypothetical protein